MQAVTVTPITADTLYFHVGVFYDGARYTVKRSAYGPELIEHNAEFKCDDLQAAQLLFQALMKQAMEFEMANLATPADREHHEDAAHNDWCDAVDDRKRQDAAIRDHLLTLQAQS